jgi:hypothetical protein
MSAGLDKLRRYITGLKAAGERLAKPAGFFEGHRTEYRNMAQNIAQAVLELAPVPAGLDPKEWLLLISETARRIGTDLLLGEEVALVIFLDVRNFEQMQFEDVARGTFAYDTVRAWVSAGTEEDPLGKHLDERDTGRTVDEISNRVWWALTTGRSRNSAEHIRAFLTGHAERTVMEHLPAILAAWTQTLSAVVRKDWRAWVRKVIKSPGAED